MAGARPLSHPQSRKPSSETQLFWLSEKYQLFSFSMLPLRNWTDGLSPTLYFSLLFRPPNTGCVSHGVQPENSPFCACLQQPASPEVTLGLRSGLGTDGHFPCVFHDCPSYGTLRTPSPCPRSSSPLPLRLLITPPLHLPYFTDAPPLLYQIHTSGLLIIIIYCQRTNRFLTKQAKFWSVNTETRFIDWTLLTSYMDINK